MNGDRADHAADQRPAVVRIPLADHVLAPGTSFEHVEVRRITLGPSVAPGAHWHNGPVFGVVETGSAILQVGSGPERTLRAGEVFFEPGDETIDRFDATEEGVTFLGWFPLPRGAEPEITIGRRG